MGERNSGQDSTVLVRPPAHPVVQLQGPFEESMLESVNDESELDQFLDPIARRNMLLEAPTYTRVVAGRWKQKPGEQYHPLWKLIAQISFGVHLLAAGMAKSEEEVMEILQSHVDEIDGFLERTTEDLDLAMEDIQERLRCLKLPLRHPEVFDRMLEDRTFRNSIVEGNEKIEHIIDRTTKNMKDSLKDVQKGFDSTTCLENYLHSLATTWQRETAEHEAVFVAMIGNVEGWRKAFMDLHLQGQKLGSYLKKLTEIINEMQQRAGEVSRRLLHQAQGFNKDRGSRSQQPLATYRSSSRQMPVSRFHSGSQGQGHKHLPTAPARPHVRQSSSKAGSLRSETPQLITIGSRNASVDKIHPQMTAPLSQSLQQTHSPQVVEVPHTPTTRIRSVIPTVVETSSPSKGNTSESGSPMINERNFIPVELPAHVPEETLRAAPMSKANRLSMGLGILPSDRKLKAASKVVSPTAALIDLLRASPKPTGMPPTPQSMSSAHASPALSVGDTKEQSESGTEYFSIKTDRSQRDRSPHPSSGIGKTINQPSSKDSPTRSRVTSPIPPSSTQNRAELKRGAFSSHPPDLPPGSPPVQQGTSPAPLIVENWTKPASNGSVTDEGTLGEPGPSEMSGSVSEFTSARLMPANPRNPKRISAFAPELVTLDTQPSQTSQPSLPTRRHVEAHQDDIVKRKRKSFIAEMEGSAPHLHEIDGSETPPPVVELEAPRQHFTLPPRPTESSSSTNANRTELSASRASNISRITALRDPTPTADRRDVKSETKEDILDTARSIPLPQSPEPTSDEQPSLDSQVVTAELSQDQRVPDEAIISKPDPVQDMIEKLTDSPSKKHEASTIHIPQRRTSHVLSPNHSAPAPPGPGGPSMVRSKTADAGQFYGERKQSHARTTSRGSTGSQSGQFVWKAFFKGQPSPVGSNLSIRTAKRSSADQKSVSEQKSPSTPGSNTPMASPRLALQESTESMMTAAGKDVLWFGAKHDGMERVALATAKKNQAQQQGRPHTPPTGPVEME